MKRHTFVPQTFVDRAQRNLPGSMRWHLKLRLAAWHFKQIAKP